MTGWGSVVSVNTNNNIFLVYSIQSGLTGDGCTLILSPIVSVLCREFQYCCYKEFEPSKTSTSLSLECCELAEQTTVQRLAPVEVQVYCRTLTSLT